MRPYVFGAMLLVFFASVLVAQAPPPQTISLIIPNGWTCSSPPAPRIIPQAGMDVKFGQGYTRDQTDANGNVIGASFLTDQSCPNSTYRQLDIGFSEEIQNVNLRFTWAGVQATLSSQGSNESAVSPSSVAFGQANVHFSGPLHGLSAVVTAPTGSWLLMIDSMTFEKADTNDRVVFDLGNKSVIERILISKTRPSDPYFDPINQIADRQLRITGKVIDQVGAPVPNRQFSLRVVDPPDNAAYSAIGNQSHTNDNVDPADAGGQGLNARLAATTLSSDASGLFSVIFTTTDRYAGDNYYVEGSVDPTFPCASSSVGCRRTSTIQAWKRIYVDKHRTLRNGMPMTATAQAGATTIRINGNKFLGNQGTHHRITRGDRIVLVHSPKIDRSDLAGGWYLEYHNVEDVQAVAGTADYIVTLGTKQGNNVTLEPLAHPFGPDPKQNPSNQQVGDAIARIAGATLTASDYFDADDTLLAQYDASGNAASAFPQAFVDYQVLSDSATPGGFVPIPWLRSSTERTLQDFADRWSASVSWSGTQSTPAPNHQLLVIGDNEGPNSEHVGLTTHNLAGEVASFCWRGMIDSETAGNNPPHAGQNPNRWAAKNVAHELTHQWVVDAVWLSTPGTTLGHCPPTTMTFDSSTTFCLEATASTNGSETQSDNLIAKFHMLQTSPGTWQSEYLEIRAHNDPFVP